MTHHHCPTVRVVDPPRVVYRDFYHPQLVEIIHPIEIINRHHCVPVPHHCYTFAVRDEFCHAPIAAPYAQIRSIKKTSIKR